MMGDPLSKHTLGSPPAEMSSSQSIPYAIISNLISTASTNPSGPSSALFRNPQYRKLWVGIYISTYQLHQIDKIEKILDELVDVEETRIEHLQWENAEHARTGLRTLSGVNPAHMSLLPLCKERLEEELQPLEVKSKHIDKVLEKIEKDEEMSPEDDMLVKECQKWAEREKELFYDKLIVSGIPHAKTQRLFQKRVRLEE